MSFMLRGKARYHKNRPRQVKTVEEPTKEIKEQPKEELIGIFDELDKAPTPKKTKEIVKILDEGELLESSTETIAGTDSDTLEIIQPENEQAVDEPPIKRKKKQ